MKPSAGTQDKEHTAPIRKWTSPYCPIYSMWQDKQTYNNFVRNVLKTHRVLTITQLTGILSMKLVNSIIAQTTVSMLNEDHFIFNISLASWISHCLFEIKL